ncbi:MAG TPA: elongation factor EF-2, partial [Methanoregula sp.]|nr:elongation factor EF-2 [Methanoregula sp.]
PIVVYRETVVQKVESVEGKSPNRHNRFYFDLEVLPDEIVDLIKKGEVSMNQPMLERRDILMTAGMGKDDAKSIKDIKGTNMLIDRTKGVQYLNETMELIIEGIHEALAGGPLADEPVQNLKMTLVDVKLHEDAIHRGPAQVIPAVRGAIKGGLLIGGDSLLEPVQKIQITVPMDQMGAATSQIQGRRGQVFDMQSEGDTITVIGKAPVAELFGFAGDIRSATEGRAMWNTEFSGFELVPNSMLKEVVVAIRKRKGLKEVFPTPADYLSV